ncbi:MAG TPA: hypothetical protein GXZ47_02270 [Treponema sp.]|nr:hypothetical protein [Treponema sp.]
MTNLDKFYSDAERTTARFIRDGKEQALSAELQRSFLEWNRSSEILAKALAGFWHQNFGLNLTTDDKRAIALQSLLALMALINGEFDDTMDFPDKAWEEIREIVSAEAESLDMETLTEIMTVIVSRGKV